MLLASVAAAARLVMDCVLCALHAEKAISVPPSHGVGVGIECWVVYVCLGVCRLEHSLLINATLAVSRFHI